MMMEKANEPDESGEEGDCSDAELDCALQDFIRVAEFKRDAKKMAQLKAYAETKSAELSSLFSGEKAAPKSTKDLAKIRQEKVKEEGDA